MGCDLQYMYGMGTGYVEPMEKCETKLADKYGKMLP